MSFPTLAKIAEEFTWFEGQLAEIGAEATLKLEQLKRGEQAAIDWYLHVSPTIEQILSVASVFPPIAPECEAVLKVLHQLDILAEKMHLAESVALKSSAERVAEAKKK